MKNEYDLKNLIALAVRILEDGTEYFLARKRIDSVFKDTTKNLSKDSINMRLTIVDSIYSTNMRVRLFGITDLAEKISSIGNDNALLEEVEKYKKNIKESKVNLLLEGNYGIKKSGRKSGEARSLISKYLYFVSEHKFPIEDSLLKSNINNVLKYFECPNIRKDSNFLHEIISFCENKSIEFDEFENFMWRLGKLSKGSLSALLSKDKYEKVIENLEIKSTKSGEIDKEIAKKIIDTKYLNLISKYEYISKDLYEFLIFIKDFKRNN